MRNIIIKKSQGKIIGQTRSMYDLWTQVLCFDFSLHALVLILGYIYFILHLVRPPPFLNYIGHARMA